MLAALLALFFATSDLSPTDRAMSDLRWLTTALEAYSTDNNGTYGDAKGPHGGAIADLDTQLAFYYKQTYPRLAAPPHLDPWGHPYRFVVSESRKNYAMYSLGASGKEEPATTAFLERLRHDRITDIDLTRERGSGNIVVATGMLVFAPADVLQALVKSRAEHGPTLINREGGTPEHRASRDVELLTLAIEAYLGSHDGLPKEHRGRVIDASALRSLLHSPIPELELSWIDPWNRPYEIAVSPSGLRAAVFTLGEQNALSAEDEAEKQRALHGTLGTATIYGHALMTTQLVPHISE